MLGYIWFSKVYLPVLAVLLHIATNKCDDVIRCIASHLLSRHPDARLSNQVTQVRRSGHLQLWGKMVLLLLCVFVFVFISGTRWSCYCCVCLSLCAKLVQVQVPGGRGTLSQVGFTLSWKLINKLLITLLIKIMPFGSI